MEYFVYLPDVGWNVLWMWGLRRRRSRRRRRWGGGGEPSEE
jgi:hypothetical protein